MKVIQPLLWGLMLAAMLMAASSLSLFMVVTDTYAASPGHAHEDHHQHAAPVGDGPWLADQTLADGMQRIEAAVGQARARGAAFDAAALSHLVQLEVVGLIENCQLAPEADAALHALLVPLLENAARLHEEGDKQAVLDALDNTLREYRNSFVAPVGETAHAH